MTEKDLDWNAIKTEFITGTASLIDLGRKYGIKGSTIRNRSAGKKTRDADNWQDLRDEWRRKVAAAAADVLAEQKKTELVTFNKNSLEIAKGIQTQIGKQLLVAQKGGFSIDPKELRLMAGALEQSQKVGRLALGVSTDNLEHTGKDGGPIESEYRQILVEDVMAARERILKEY